MLVRRQWGNIVDALAFVALWYVAGTAMCNTGCGDLCDQCPSGSECVQVASGSLTSQRWECKQTVKVMERKWLLSGGDGSGPATPGSGPVDGTGGTDSGE